MSTVVAGIGLMLDKKEAQIFAEKAGIAIDGLDAVSNHDICFVYEPDHEEDIRLQTLSGEIKYFDTFCVVFYADRCPLKIVGVTYNTKEEIIDEFRKDIGRFLPEDFDYEGHIGSFEGAVLY